MLGWRTYANQLMAYAETRPDLDLRFKLFAFPHYLTFSISRHYLHPVQRVLPLMDPMQAAKFSLYSWWRTYQKKYSRPDAVHVATQNLAGLFAVDDDSVPFSVIIDTTRKAMEAEHNIGVWKAWHIQRETSIFEQASHIYAMSQWAAASVRSDYQIPSSKISTMLPSLQLEQFKDRLPSNRKRLNIIFIGSDFKRKGGDRLVRWMSGPLKDICHLHIVSGDPRVPESGANITAYGRVDHRQIVEDILPAMDVFCLPTLLDM